MSKEEFIKVIGRACVDGKFREDLKKNPEQAVKKSGFTLTPREINLLKTSKLDGLDAFASELLGKKVMTRGQDCWNPNENC